MSLLIPSLLLLSLILLLPPPAHMISSTNQELEVRGQRSPREAKMNAIKVVISEGCISQEGSTTDPGGKEIELAPGSPLVLTHKIQLVPSGSGSGSGSCGCEADFAALRERVERLEREVSALREKCGGPEEGCCASKESKGSGCSIKPDSGGCPNECSDQGRCVDGRCVCFPGFSGPDCSSSNCPDNCNNRGRCMDGQCVCDPGFSGPDCSLNCPDNCSDRGRCVNGRCVCDGGFTGPSCSDESCAGNCNNRGHCVDGRCVCNSGFAGPDCSESACPDNCNNRGRCADGECVCDEGFGGEDCSEILCLNDCFDRGRCDNGQCVCESGFSGDDCSEATCTGNCNNRGRCVNGKCVCEKGFTGSECSEATCPGNCNNRGRCVNGKCVCEKGFTGNECSEATCPGNCNNRGRCVNGKCVCEKGSTGDDCSKSACPGNCNNRGRCMNGKCVCKKGFTGDECSEAACPGNCNKHGKCVNGKCVCDVGFTGLDCASKQCPKNCSSKGSCHKGKCVCSTGFTGPDCSQCVEGRTGPNCDVAMYGVSQLRTEEVGESSVTVVWTPPPGVRYDVYHLTFSSQKESDQQVAVEVGGGLNTFTQTGLAASQEYSVTVTGEIGGRRGAESSAHFTTLASGPSNLRVVKTTTTSAVVQWEESQGEIDRYRLTISHGDGTGRVRELTVPAGQDSAHIQQLEAGRLYDVTLTAERESSQSAAATTTVTPGPEPPTDIIFNGVTDSSMTVSWTKPKSAVSGFKVTYTHAEEGEPVSVSVGSDDASVDLSHLSPGSTYEVNVISVLGLDESDPLSDTIITLPDPPMDLQALNVTDTRALLLWRPSIAAIDQYNIVYRAQSGAGIRVTVSGNEGQQQQQQLNDLEKSTTYSVTITSQLGAQESTETTGSFTTTRGSGADGAGPQDLQALNVSPRTAMLSWKPPANPVASYRLTYQTEGQEMKEVTVSGSLTKFDLVSLHPGSMYAVQLQTTGGPAGRAISTEFTTGVLMFPFPSDCSQELLNGVRKSGEVELFPHGKLGKLLRVYCDMETDGGGWMVFQRRMDGSEDFYRDLANYVKGFGSLSGEFWLGLENLQNLTMTTKMTLRVDLRTADEAVFAKYSTFEVLKRTYKLIVGGYSGTAGDSLTYHSGQRFSTYDRDLSVSITRCAMSYGGGWWYKNCHQANLNGLYGFNTDQKGLIWKTWKDYKFSIPFTEMKMRPTSFNPSNRR